MKIIIFSDSHSDVDTMDVVVNAEAPDMIIHLGDHTADIAELHAKHDGIPAEYVKGNTDITEECESEKMIRINDICIFLTHGDRYNVEQGCSDVIAKGMDCVAGIILFGHTHKPYLKYDNGIWIMNPGRIGRKSCRKINATYGILMIDDLSVECAIRSFESINETKSFSPFPGRP